MGNASSTDASYEVLYRPPTDGEDSAHEHPVQKITRKQIHIERTAEDGTLVGAEEDAEKACHLSRDELEAYGSVLHSPTRVRFYEDREAAEASGARSPMGHPPY